MDRAFFFTKYHYDRPHYTDGRKGANRHFIGLLEEGQCRLSCQDVTIEAGPGEPFYIPKDLPYQSWWWSDTKVRLRSYGFDWFPESRNGAYALQKLPASFASAIAAIPTQKKPDSLALGRFYGVLAQLLPQMQPRKESGEERLWKQAQAFLRDHPDCRMGDAARHCGISESALYALFRRHGEQTPNELRQALVVKTAVSLLTTTDCSIQEISDRLDFSSASYFRKVLRKHTGKTPSQIRKTAAKV